MKFIPHDYQEVAKEFALERDAAGLFLDMGLGKTVITLTAIEELKNDYLEDVKVLVIAPKGLQKIPGLPNMKSGIILKI